MTIGQTDVMNLKLKRERNFNYAKVTDFLLIMAEILEREKKTVNCAATHSSVGKIKQTLNCFNFYFIHVSGYITEKTVSNV